MLSPARTAKNPHVPSLAEYFEGTGYCDDSRGSARNPATTDAGIANAMFSTPPPLNLETTRPTKSPLRSNSGPPEFPSEIAASVWIIAVGAISPGFRCADSSSVLTMTARCVFDTMWQRQARKVWMRMLVQVQLLSRLVAATAWA